MHKADLGSGRANKTAQVKEAGFVAQVSAAENTSCNHGCEMSGLMVTSLGDKRAGRVIGEKWVDKLGTAP